MNHTYRCYACNRVWPTEDVVEECPFCEARNIEERDGLKEGGTRSVIYKCGGFFNTDYRDSFIPGDDGSRGGNPY